MTAPATQAPERWALITACRNYMAQGCNPSNGFAKEDISMPLTPYRILVFLSVFTLLFGSSAALAQQGSIREAIEEGNKQWSAALS